MEELRGLMRRYPTLTTIVFGIVAFKLAFNFFRGAEEHAAEQRALAKLQAEQAEKRRLEDARDEADRKARYARECNGNVAPDWCYNIHSWDGSLVWAPRSRDPDIRKALGQD